MTLEIDGKKYVEVPDWTSAQTMRDINYAYLEQLPPTDLVWFLENCLALLKKKTTDIRLPRNSFCLFCAYRPSEAATSGSYRITNYLTFL